MREQELTHLEDSLRKRLDARVRRKRRRMPVTGRGVFTLQKILRSKGTR